MGILYQNWHQVLGDIQNMGHTKQGAPLFLPPVSVEVRQHRPIVLKMCLQVPGEVRKRWSIENSFGKCWPFPGMELQREHFFEKKNKYLRFPGK